MTSERTDEYLIRVYFSSQPGYCVELLYRRYHQKIYHQCRQLTHNPEQAQDFTQDIFIKLCQKLSSFQARSRFSTWLYALAHNYCRDQMKRAERLPTTAISAQLEMSLIDQAETVSEPEEARRLSQALARLSQAEQTLLRLKYEQDMSLNELARQSGLSISAVKMRLKRSREKIQRGYAIPLAA